MGVEVRAEMIQVWIGPDMDESGELSGGRKVWVCARCWRRNEWTPFGTERDGVVGPTQT